MKCVKNMFNSILILIIILAMSSTVIAVDNTCKLTLSSEKQVMPGEIVEVTLKVSDVNAGTGIAMISFLLDYDTNFFDGIEYEACANWDKPSAIENYITINTSNLESTKENQDICKIKVKTKSTIAEGSYNVTLKSIEVATDDNSFKVDDVIGNIVVKKETNKIENEVESKNAIQNDNSNMNDKETTLNSNNNAVKDTKQNKILETTDKMAKGQLPKAGFVKNIGIIIIAILMIGVIAYFKYKKYSSIK